MRITTTSLCLLGLAIATNAVYAQSAKSPSASDLGGAGKAVMALEQKWLQSQQTNDATLLEPLLADDVADTSTDGKLLTGKAAVIKDAKAVKWTSAEYTDMQVTIRASGINMISQIPRANLSPVAHAVRGLVHLCDSTTDDLIGTDVSMRDEAFRKRIGL